MSKVLTLSLVIPVYNEEDHLAACLEAVAQQTVMPDEVIVVDNNPSDRTAAVAARFPFVRLVRERRQGIVYARDRGFDAARSELIGRIDADTVLSETWVADMKAAYAGGRGFALTGGAYFYNVPLPRFSGWLQGQIAFRANRFIMGHYILWGSNMVIPRAMWRTVRGDLCRRTDIHEDLDLAIHVHRRGFPITFRSGLQVGVKMKRIFTEREALRANLEWWPQTLRVHGLRRAWLGEVGAELLYRGAPLIRLSERLRAAARRLSLWHRYLLAPYTAPTDQD